MQIINGAANPKLNSVEDISEHATKVADPNFPPAAKEFAFGRIVTRIWANRNQWGDVTWKVDQVRRDYSGTLRKFRGHYFDDLKDAVRGLYSAGQWIRRAEKRRTRRGFWQW